MTKKHTSIDRLAAVTAAQAQRENAALKSDLARLRDSVAGLNRHLRAINPISRGKTKKTTVSASLLTDIGVGGVESLLSGGYSSAAQSASNNLTSFVLGQRIR